MPQGSDVDLNVKDDVLMMKESYIILRSKSQVQWALFVLLSRDTSTNCSLYFISKLS